MYVHICQTFLKFKSGKNPLNSRLLSQSNQNIYIYTESEKSLGSQVTQPFIVCNSK